MGRSESLEKAEAQIVGKILASAAEGCVLDPPCLEKPRSVSKAKLDGLLGLLMDWDDGGIVSSTCSR